MIHIIYVVDVSKSMMGSKIESAKETIREISDTSNIYYSIITFANSADIVCEFCPYNYEFINGINVCKGLSNINVGIVKATQLIEKYKTPSILICLTDSLFTNSIPNLEIGNSLLLEKIFVFYTKTNIAQLYAKDFSLFFNNEKGLKEISGRISSRAKSIWENYDNNGYEANRDQPFEISEETDFISDKDDPKWS